LDNKCRYKNNILIMSISKPFAYNVGGPISGTTQYGDLVVGNIETDYSINYGGIKWWGGPNEELGYVIGNARPGGQPVPAGVTGPAYVGFFRSELLTDESFLSLANYIGSENSEPPFATTSDAVTWLNANGYYTSYSASTQSTGYYIGGDFTIVNEIYSAGLISLNSGGTTNVAFYSNFGFETAPFDWIRSIAIDSNGKILVGGGFTEFQELSQNRLIRLNSDGSKDTSFNIGSGFNGNVNAVAIQSDGKILIGGDFTTFTGSSQNRLIRLNTNGSKDSSFNIGTGFDSQIQSVSIQSDGKILVGGQFTEFKGNLQNYLIRLNTNGSKDETFDIENGFDATVYSTSIQSDGKILVGGSFTTFNFSSQNYLIRLNTNGSKDETFNIGSGFANFVYSTSIQSDGKILVGGDFAQFTGSSQNHLIRLNSDGSKDETFDIGSGLDYGSVLSTAIQSDGKILAGGTFTSFSGISQNRLIRLNSDGSKDETFDIENGINYAVFSISIDSAGNIWTGGEFNTYGGFFSNYLVKISNDLVTINETFDIGSGFNGTVTAVAIQSDGKILVGGGFTTFTGSQQNYLIRLNSNGTKDSSFNIGTGFDNSVNAIAIQSDGKIMVGGSFFEEGGGLAYYLTRLNSDGSNDVTFDIGTGFDYYVYATEIQSDGKILVGGGFSTFTGSPQNGLIRLNSDGSKDTSFDIGTGFNDRVESIATQSNGKILVGGAFSTFTGSTQNRLIRLNSDGSKDTTFNIGTGFDAIVYSIKVQSDGKILVGGGFTTFTGSSQNNLIRLNSDGSKDETFDIYLSGSWSDVYSIKIDSNGKIVVCGVVNKVLNNDGSVYGYFPSVNGNVRSIGL